MYSGQSPVVPSSGFSSKICQMESPWATFLYIGPRYLGFCRHELRICTSLIASLSGSHIVLKRIHSNVLWAMYGYIAQSLKQCPIVVFAARRDEMKVELWATYMYVAWSCFSVCLSCFIAEIESRIITTYVRVQRSRLLLFVVTALSLNRHELRSYT